MKFIKEALYSQISFVSILIILIVLHEIVHWSILALLGFSSKIVLMSFIPHVSIDLDLLNSYELFAAVIFPYIIDFYIIIFFQRNNFYKIISLAALSDIIFNFIVMFAYKVNDFFYILERTHLGLIVLIIVISSVYFSYKFKMFDGIIKYIKVIVNNRP